MEQKNLSQIIRETILIYKERFIPFLTLVALAQIPILILDSLISTPEDAFTQFGISTIVSVVQMILIAGLTLFSIIMMYAAAAHALSRHLEGSQINVLRSYEVAWQRNKRLAAAGGIIGLAVAAMLLTVIGIPVAVYYGVRWTFALPAAMLEGVGPRESLSRSDFLVRDRWWKVFAIVVVLMLLWGFPSMVSIGIISLLLQYLLGLFIDSPSLITGLVGFIGGLVWIVFTPVLLIGLTLVYWDLRVRKEGIDKDAISEQLDISSEDLESALSDPEDALEPSIGGLADRPNKLSSRRKKQFVELQLRQSFSSKRSWVAIAIVLAVLVVGYYSILAMRYWQASEESGVLRAAILNASRDLRQDFKRPEDLEPKLEPKLANLEALKEDFVYANSDALVAILSETSQEIPIALTSISIGKASKKNEGSTSYQTQPMTISLRGSTQDLYSFIDRLHEKVIVTSVTNVRIGNVSGEIPSTQVGLLFFLEPEPATTSDAKGGSK